MFCPVGASGIFWATDDWQETSWGARANACDPDCVRHLGDVKGPLLTNTPIGAVLIYIWDRWQLLGSSPVCWLKSRVSRATWPGFGAGSIASWLLMGFSFLIWRRGNHTAHTVGDWGIGNEQVLRGGSNHCWGRRWRFLEEVHLKWASVDD